ncbi:hypothetical protein LMG28614_06002 [Paraburkholderia ultramafica]|uniref:Uncharacterized protein n=1 Tax=Paraburkholderia ultramafica TaxID=1544867 RepID=A0A6S7BL69_9BURK|nr:hypothetical protein [Paraburkholderia ultramafica]CAB3804295.1 hypothetical protein LMG28614_06002 [Paraburkholderia ultramafica]
MGNEGIIVKGRGKFTTEQAISGRHSKIINNYGQCDRDLLIEKIDNLLRQIHNADLSESERGIVLEAARSIKAEAQSNAPDKTLVEKSLALIEKSAPAFTAIAAAGKTVRELVSMWANQ